MPRLFPNVFLAALTLGGPSAAAAVVPPFTEDFTAGGANWRQNGSALDVPRVATGGPDGAGDAYIEYSRSLGTSTGVQVTFRGQDAADASNDAFVGNWLAAGVTELSFWVRHDAPAPLAFGARFAPAANFPAVSIYAAAPVPANAWTRVVVDVNASNPGWLNEGAGATTAEAFRNTFVNVANIQVFAQRDAGVPENTTVTFGLDKVQVVPEPASLATLGAGAAVAGLVARPGRRRRPRPRDARG